MSEMLIQNYGLFWKRSDVYWGRKNSSGTLLGDYVGKKDCIVDFRRQKGIYCLYDSNFNLVYVGQAGSGKDRLFKRLRMHLKDHLSARWTLFSWFGTLKVLRDEDEETYNLDEESLRKLPSDMSTVLNQMEAVLISAAEPPLNRQGGRFGDAKQYLQKRDEDQLYQSVENMVRGLWDELIDD